MAGLLPGARDGRSVTGRPPQRGFGVEPAPAFRLIACSFCALVLFLPFQVAALANRRVPPASDRAAWDRYIREGRDSPFGLDYVYVLDRRFRNPELARFFGEEVGIRWVNFARVSWGEIEKRPPIRGRHNYDWSGLDEGVREWQSHGVHIMMSLRLHSPWGSAKPSGDQYIYLDGLVKAVAMKSADYRPKPEHIQDFRDFIANLVERYDGDGDKDMPGLLFPILHYQPGNECYNELFWAGTVDEYGLVLKEATLAARQASPNVKIVLSGVGLGEEVVGFYDDKPDPLSQAYVEEHSPQVPPKMRRFVQHGFEFSKKTLQFDAWYDILDARNPHYGFVREWQRLLRQAGHPDKEVWSAEIYAVAPLGEEMMLPNSLLEARPIPPAAPSTAASCTTRKTRSSTPSTAGIALTRLRTWSRCAWSPCTPARRSS